MWSSESCSDKGKSYISLAAGVVALLGPHLINDTVYKSEQSKVQFNFGNDNFIGVYFDLNSNVIKNMNWIINTDLDLKIYSNKDKTSNFKYGIGGGYKFYIDNFSYFLPLIKYSATKVETIDKYFSAIETDIISSYSYNGKYGLEFDGQALFYPDSVLRFIIGVSYRPLKLAESTKFTVSLGYEDNNFFKQKLYFLSLGAIF